MCVCDEREKERENACACVLPAQAKIIKRNHLLSYWWVEKAKGTKSLVLFPQPTFSVSGSFQKTVLSPFFTSFFSILPMLLMLVQTNQKSFPIPPFFSGKVKPQVKLMTPSIRNETWPGNCTFVASTKILKINK